MNGPRISVHCYANSEEEVIQETFRTYLKARMTKEKTHCESCGEWLEGFDQCSQCGRINK